MEANVPQPGQERMPFETAPRHRVGRFASTGALAWRTLREVVLGGLPVLGIIALCLLVIREVRRPDIEVAPIAVPSRLAEMGLSPEVVAQRLVDQIDAVARAAKSDNTERPATELSGALPDLNVPLTGLSLRSVASLVRNVLGIPPRRVNGEIILQPNDRLALRLRMFGSGQIANIEGFDRSEIDKLLGAAAPEVWRVTVPQLYAWYIAEHEPRQEDVRAKLMPLRGNGRANSQLANTVSFLMARSFLRSGQPGETLAITAELTKNSPVYAPGWYARALALSDLNRPQDAVEAHRHALSLDPNSTWAHKGAARIFIAGGNGAAALEEIHTARQIEPDDTDLAILESAALSISGRANDAVVAAERAINAEPAALGLHEALANALLSKGDPEGAIKEFDAELERDPRKLSALVGRARASLAMHHNDEALAIAETALQIAPHQPAALIIRGFALIGVGRSSEALQLFEHMLTLRPDGPAILRGKALALAAQGQTQAAIETLQHALNVAPQDRRLRAELEQLRGAH
jgi:tetratricopeptide (TPR) repeat protein